MEKNVQKSAVQMESEHRIAGEKRQAEYKARKKAKKDQQLSLLKRAKKQRAAQSRRYAN